MRTHSFFNFHDKAQAPSASIEPAFNLLHRIQSEKQAYLRSQLAKLEVQKAKRKRKKDNKHDAIIDYTTARPAQLTFLEADPERLKMCQALPRSPSVRIGYHRLRYSPKKTGVLIYCPFKFFDSNFASVDYGFPIQAITRSLHLAVIHASDGWFYPLDIYDLFATVAALKDAEIQERSLSPYSAMRQKFNLAQLEAEEESVHDYCDSDLDEDLSAICEKTCMSP